MKKLVLEAVSRPTTHAQDSRVEVDSFSIVYSCISCKFLSFIKPCIKF